MPRIQSAAEIVCNPYNPHSSEAKEFVEKHGGVFIWDEKQKLYLCKDGARFTGLDSSGCLYPPPDDDWQRAKLVEKFAWIVATDCVKTVENYKLRLESKTAEAIRIKSAGPLGDQEAAIAELKRLKGQERRALKALNDAREAVAAATPHHITVRQQLEAESISTAETFRSKIRAIR